MKKHLLSRITISTLIIAVLSAFFHPLEISNKDYPVDEFTKLAISVNAKVYVEQGDSYKLDIQAADSDMEKISVKNNSGKLEIKCQKDCKFNEPVKIFITTTDLGIIEISGSTEVLIEKTFKTGKLHLSVAGSGKVSMKELKAEEMSARIAGSGEIVLAGGMAKSESEFKIAGSGKIDALGYEAVNVKVDIAGSGKCIVYATKDLHVSIAGSGSVDYKGNPQLHKDIAGSGKVSTVRD